ncbi:methyl-accepting chemotaxis protein [Paraburkholderia sp. XV]|uniref:methyl-accepting chemotaxis protein n=1 Tax=Paraburkholderia sp. XV TaxID=2831520 RepID=UPI001CD63244|nr:methyl-accepting chemotaxis protein [Paraburkholderia sp. XV]
MSIGKRLAATFSVLLLLILGLVVAVNRQMADMNEAMSSIVHDHQEKQRAIGKVKEETYKISLMAYEAVDDASNSAGASSSIAVIQNTIRNAGVEVRQLQSKFYGGPDDSALYAFEESRRKYDAALQPILQQLTGQQVLASTVQVVAIEPLQSALLASLDQLSDHEQRATALAEGRARQAYHHALTVLWGCAALALIVSLSFGVIVTRSIVIPLRMVVAGADALATGDVSFQLRETGEDEISALSGALNRAVRSLASIVHDVKLASESIATVTNQLSVGYTSLAQRTEQQAAALQQTSATIEHLSDAVRRNSAHAEQVSLSMKQTTAIADRGEEQTALSVRTMHEIAEGSSRITEIVSLIESIAFQTNLLALNAAIEAARAGAHGRGFAVVSGEVRMLAQRTGDAAKRIKDMISTSVEAVNAGSAKARQTGETINDVVLAVKDASRIVSAIAEASADQSGRIQEINQAVSEIDAVTQQNAALVEEAAAATIAMEQQAESLRFAVARFRVV